MVLFNVRMKLARKGNSEVKIWPVFSRIYFKPQANNLGVEGKAQRCSAHARSTYGTDNLFWETIISLPQIVYSML